MNTFKRTTVIGPRVLPVIARMCKSIVQVFMKHSDVSGEFKADDIFQHWVNAGQVSPQAVNRFIWLLSKEIEDTDARVEFVREARKCIHL